MGDRSAIEWTNATWNPLRGCSRVSPGCQRCYAERQAGRFINGAYHGLVKRVMVDSARGTTEARWTGKIEFVEEALTLPLRWRQPRRIFVNSMSDLFHERVSDEWIDRIFAVMALAPHTFQVLTKRPERMRDYMRAPLRKRAMAETVMEISERRAHEAGTGKARITLADFSAVFKGGGPFPNVHLGVSVEDQARADARIPLLLQTPAAVRWVSYEPALGPVDFSSFLNAPRPAAPGAIDHALETSQVGGPATLDWLVVGGESGPGSRPFDLAWARSVIAQCRAAHVSVFVKQLGARPVAERVLYGVGPWGPAKGDVIEERLRLRDRKGGDWSEWPEDLRVREWPRV
jgi:protein gp37